MTQIAIESWSGAGVVSRLEDLSGVYAKVYAESPYNSGELWSVDAFKDRTSRQATRDGFSFLAALSGREVVGFSFGLTFGEGVWWSGDATKPPSDLLAASKFAVIELVVCIEWRRMGIGRQLLDGLLADRPESFAVLTAMPNAAAREMYRRWGWVQTGTAHHAPGSPVLDALAHVLPI